MTLSVHHWLRIFGTSLAFFLCSVAQAQENDFTIDADTDNLDQLSLEQLLNVVYTATKTKESVYNSPAIVTVISRRDIAAWGYNSVAEILQHVAGFYIIDDHVLPNIGVRGISGGLRSESSVVKVMIDGHSVAYRSTSGNWLGTELIPLSAIERVEILRGPASALYGADAFLGVVNIITRDGAKVDGAQVGLGTNIINNNYGGGYDATVGSRQGRFELLLSSRTFSEDRSGMDLPSSSPAPIIPEYKLEQPIATGMRRTTGTGLVKLAYNFSPQTKLSVIGYAAALDASGEFADWFQLAHGVDKEGRFSENRTSLAHGFVNLHFETQLWEQVDLSVDGKYFAGGVTPFDRVEVGSDIFYIERDFGYRGFDAQATGHWRYDESLSILAGVDLLWDDENLPSALRVLKVSTKSARAGSLHEKSSARQERQVFFNPGANAQVIWKPLGPTLGVTSGLRYDYHNIYGNQISGRMGLVSSPYDTFHAKLLYGSAFKAPSPLQLYALPYRSGDVIGNPELEAQRVHTIETQLVSEIGKSVVVSGGAAYNIVLGKAEFTPQGVNQIASNVSQVHTLSIESELLVRHQNWLAGYLNVALNSGIRQSGEEGYRSTLLGNQNVLYPPAIVNVGARYKIHGVPARVSGEVSWVSWRRASAENILENGGGYRLEPYAVAGFCASTVDLYMFREMKQTTVSICGRNILESKGVDPGFGGVDYPPTGRMFILKVGQEI